MILDKVPLDEKGYQLKHNSSKEVVVKDLSTVNYIIFYAIFVSPPLPSRPPPSLAEG
jgi:hypothetical protein